MLTPFSPRNRHILLKGVEKKKKKEVHEILLPKGYKPEEDEYVIMQAWAYAPDCKLERHRSHLVVVRRNMIEEIDLGGKKYKLVLENYVVGYVDEEEEEGAN